MRIVQLTLVMTLMFCIVAVSMLIGLNAAWNNNPYPTPEQAPTTPPENDPVIEPEEPAKNILVLGKTKLEVGIFVGDSIKEIDKDTAMFGDNLGWTPGQIKMVSLALTNNGDADVDFSIGINVIDEKSAVNTAGEEFNLSDYIQFALIKGTDIFDGEVVGVQTIGADYISAGPIKAESNLEIYTLALTIPEDVAQKVAVAEGGEAPDIELGLIVLATTPYGPSLDDMEEEVETPTVPEYFEGSESVENIVVDGVISEPVTIGGGENSSMSAVVPEGVKLEEGVTELTFSVTGVEESEANIEVKNGERKYTLDVHVDGVSADNEQPILVAINEVFPAGLTTGNIKIYHVEDGETIEMTQVSSIEELDAHNEFYYDIATGNVRLALASFSEIAVTVDNSNPWNGTDADTSWYNTNDTEFLLKDTADLVGFAQIVGGMADGIERDTFEGKTVKLDVDMNLGGHIFEPVGYYFTRDYNGDGVESNAKADVYSTVYAFKGTFDGQGHVISNFYQNTWEIKGDNAYYNIEGGEHYYKDGMGLFGYVYDGTVQNLIVDNFHSDGEFTPTGCVAAYAAGENTVFKNIRITNCNPRVYNTGNGGIVGIASDDSTLTFEKISVEASTKISALWGSWDVGCGGIVGMMYNNTKLNFDGCTVTCEIDVYNDVCGNYQYYQYRYCGMFIGTAGRDGDPSDQIIKNVKAKDCYVYYGDWVDHYYCELVANSLASYTHDHQMSRLEKISNISEISSDGGTTWTKTGNYYLVTSDNTKICYHIVKDENGNLYRHNHEDEGYETVDGVEVLKEDKQLVHIPFNQLYTGYGWGASPSADGIKVTKYIYTITYINDGKVLAIDYISDNSSAHTVGNADAQELVVEWAGNNIEGTVVFGGWMNAGSTKITKIAADNKENIVLYPYFDSPYTASFVDQNGNILAWCFFNENDTSNLADALSEAESKLPYLGEDLKFDYWEVHYIEDDGKVTVTKFDEYDFAKADRDVTVYPVYLFKGDVNLVPVDSDGDGITNYYQVAGYSNPAGQAMVEIPASVNGKPILQINQNAFSSYDGVHSIVVPKGVTIQKNAFTSGSSFGNGEEITIYYEGTKDDWLNNINVTKEDGWDYGIGTGSRVFFLKDGKVNTDEGYLEVIGKGGFLGWGTEYSWSENTDISSVKNTYTGECNCKEKDTTGDTGHIYVSVDANGNETVLKHNDVGTPVNDQGVAIYWGVIKEATNWWESDEEGFTDGTNTNYKRYRADRVYWEGVTA